MELNNDLKMVYITLQLSAETNRLLTEAATRSKRKKVQEAKLRLDDHLHRFFSETNFVTSSSDKDFILTTKI